MAGLVVVAALAGEAPVTLGKWICSYLKPESITSIEMAIERAEKNTTGEIVPIVVQNSTPIGNLPMILALAVFSGLLVVTFEVLAMDFYQYQFILLPSLALLSLGIGIFLSRLKAFQKLLTHPSDQKICVMERAELEFVRHKMTATKNRTGILLLISMMERRAVVLADKSISDLLPPETWTEVVRLMTSELKSKNLEKGLVLAIEKCGQILAQHFPSQANDTNELPNKLILID